MRGAARTMHNKLPATLLMPDTVHWDALRLT